MGPLIASLKLIRSPILPAGYIKSITQSAFSKPNKIPPYNTLSGSAFSKPNKIHPNKITSFLAGRNKNELNG